MQINNKTVKSFRQMQRAFDEMFTKAPQVVTANFQELSDQAEKLSDMIANGERKVRATRKAKRKVLEEEKEQQRTERKKEVQANKEKERRAIALQRERERVAASKDRERQRILSEEFKAQRLPNREIDLTACIHVQLDSKTVVYVKPGTDIEKTKRIFRERNNNR
jgi:dsDNA-specific endonuclease/ATPase MutS2